jgi:hypothetical protein
VSDPTTHLPVCRDFAHLSESRCGPFAARDSGLRATETTEDVYCRANGGTGATGLEPATSGVTGRARGVTILPATIRKSLLSRRFGEAQSTGLYDSARPSTMASPSTPHRAVDAVASTRSVNVGVAAQPEAWRYRSLAERRRSAAASITSQASTPLHSHAAAARRSRFIAWSLSI